MIHNPCENTDCEHELYAIYPFGKLIVICGKGCGGEFTEQDYHFLNNRRIKKRYKELREWGNLHIASLNIIKNESNLTYKEIVDILGENSE